MKNAEQLENAATIFTLAAMSFCLISVIFVVYHSSKLCWKVKIVGIVNLILYK